MGIAGAPGKDSGFWDWGFRLCDLGLQGSLRKCHIDLLFSLNSPQKARVGFCLLPKP